MIKKKRNFYNIRNISIYIERSRVETYYSLNNWCKLFINSDSWL